MRHKFEKGNRFGPKDRTKNLGIYAQEGAIPWNKGLKKVWFKNCIGCNKRFEVQFYRKGSAKYCSHECAPIWNKGLKGYNAGEKNSRWKGGITPKDRLERSKFRLTMQKAIFERDNYTCQLCGIRGVDLQVDHIQSWAEYIELRFSMNNCRTVCARCHYKITFEKPMPKNLKAWGHNLLKGGVLL